MLQNILIYSKPARQLNTAKVAKYQFCYYYGPSVISVTVTKGGYLSSGGLYRTSGTMGRGVAESRRQLNIQKRGNVETRYTDVPTYRRTQLLLQGGVMYLSTQSLPLDSSFFCSDSQNIKELIYQVNTLLVIYIN